MKEMHNAAMKQFKAVYEAEQRYRSAHAANRATGKRPNPLGEMARLRHIEGITKIIPTFEYVKEMMETTDRKVTVFAHHDDVLEHLGELLKKEGYKLLWLLSGQSKESQQRTKDNFNEPNDHRILLTKTLVGGVGHNLQDQCYTAVMMERQWNPANEEQAESRFTRHGSQKMGGQMDAIYMVSNAGIDQHLTALVEEKRAMMNETLDWGEGEMNTNLMQELMERLARAE